MRLHALIKFDILPKQISIDYHTYLFVFFSGGGGLHKAFHSLLSVGNHYAFFHGPCSARTNEGGCINVLQSQFFAFKNYHCRNRFNS